MGTPICSDPVCLCHHAVYFGKQQASLDGNVVATMLAELISGIKKNMEY